MIATQPAISSPLSQLPETPKPKIRTTQLIYFSKAAKPYCLDDLQAILATSRRNNVRSNITGILLHHDGAILQILEGEDNAVQLLYERISMDVRHKGVLPIAKRNIDRRDFADWSMGFRDISDEEKVRLDGYNDLLNSVSGSKDESHMSESVQKLIKSYRKLYSDADDS